MNLKSVLCLVFVPFNYQYINGEYTWQNKFEISLLTDVEASTNVVVPYHRILFIIVVDIVHVVSNLRKRKVRVMFKYECNQIYNFPHIYA